MLKFVPYVMKSALRNRGRSLLTVIGVGVAVFIVTGLASILESRTRALESTSETIIIVAEKDQYWPSKSKIPGDRGLVRRIESDEVPGALRATPLIIRQNLWATSGGGLVKVAGMDKESLREFYDIQVDDDVWQEFLTRRNGALLGIGLVEDSGLRRQYSWEPGRSFGLDFLGNEELFMVGTFVPRDPTLRKVILAGAEFVQDTVGIRGEASQLLVKVSHRDEVEAVSASIMGLAHATDLSAESQRQALDEALADLDDMLRYASHVMLAVGIVILIGLANATSMAVRERIREVGMLRSLGFSRRRVLGLIASESVLLAVLGGVLGCGASWLVVKLSGGSIYVSGFAFPLQMSIMLPAIAVVGAMAVGIVGALPAGIGVSRRPIVEAIRSVD